MSFRGRRGLGALAMLFVLLASTLAALPLYALGQANQITGVVSDCASPSTFLSGARVTLTDANGAQAPSTVTTSGDGTYAFTPNPGFYHLLVERNGYFSTETATPFRFDGTATVVRDFCLTRTPTADRTLNLLLLTAAAVDRDETVSFPSTSTSNENVASTWDAAANTVQVSKRPLTSVGISIRYERVNGTYTKTFVEGVDFAVVDYWTGRIEILDPIAIGDLDTDRTRSFVYATYLSWTPSSRLQNFPVVEGSYTAYKNDVSWMAEEGVDWTLNIDTGAVAILGNFINGTDVLRFTYRSATALSGATVDMYYPPQDQVVASATTSATGTASFTLWADTFELRASLTGFAPNVTSVTISAASTSLRVRMEGGVVVTGHARDNQGRFITASLTGTLYNTNPAVVGAKVIRANVVGSLYTFNAPPGTYRMVIDANGFRAADVGITLASGSVLQSVTLERSDPELYRTTVVYGASDWNNLTVYRNLTLNPDTTLPNLQPAGLRDLRLQIDHTLGNGNGILEAAEAAAFQAWFQANGPFYVTTDSFLTTNGKAYLSATSYSVTVQGLLTSGAKVFVNTTATYSLKTAPPYIAFGAKNYFVNLTAIPDSNVSVYQNYTYAIILPRSYERVSSSVLPTTAPVRVENFTRITVDPGVTTSPPQVRMTIERSLNGTARAKVTGPAGKFHVQNATFTNYTAFVAGNTTITFSAEDSTDPVGDITKANFTWRFAAGLGGLRYGIRPEFNFTAPGEQRVNLTVTETGGNRTFREITIFVDDRLPIAVMRTNRTGSGSANDVTLLVNEDVQVRFDGVLSTDLAFPGKDGVILESGYAWDFNGDRITDVTGRTVTWTFDKPGEFKVNLTVTDAVGWKSLNATLTARVNDTTAPVPSFDILDPSREYAIASTLVERKEYAFNASKTTDNFDKLADLNFTWIVPGPVIGRTGTNNTFYGMNISFAWAEHNQSYRVLLSVRDTGFGSNKPSTGNITRSITVEIDASLHADLRIDADPVTRALLKVDPMNPEEGTTITVTVNVTNKPDRAAAIDVTVELALVRGTETNVLAATAQWFDSTGAPKATRTINAGETVTIVLQTTAVGQGNRTVRVTVSDSTEPSAWRTSENSASLAINVREPWWQPYAIWGSVIGVIALFVFGMYARRKIKAGEWRPIRGRRGKREESEKKPRKEVKEEKKRL